MGLMQRRDTLMGELREVMKGEQSVELSQRPADLRQRRRDGCGLPDGPPRRQVHRLPEVANYLNEVRKDGMV